MPDYFTYGETHEITISYIRPTSCYAFNDIYYLKENNTRTVAVISSVYDNQTNCSEIQQEVNTTFTVEAIQEENYIFNFWQGEDSNGNDMYLTIEVPVEQ
ncbi:MAG TPA: hypothetical protein EYO76_03230 [Flavobacteriaceae bacterium]|nr:hypothetical protein [Flavobacteriaceae bacterium]